MAQSDVGINDRNASDQRAMQDFAAGSTRSIGIISIADEKLVE